MCTLVASPTPPVSTWTTHLYPWADGPVGILVCISIHPESRRGPGWDATGAGCPRQRSSDMPLLLGYRGYASITRAEPFNGPGLRGA